MEAEAWFRDLQNGRIEISCKGGQIALRLTAPESEAWRFVDLFEEATGLSVSGERRPARSKPVMKGQMTLMDP